MITNAQIRAARALLGLSTEALASSAGLATADLDQIERGETAGDMDSFHRLRQALEQQGVVFLAAGQDDPGVGPGLRLRDQPSDEGIRPENLSSANDG